MNRNYYVSGSNNVYCAVCNKKFKSFEMKIRYDNLICCPYCYNPRHPQEYPPKIRPEIPPKLIMPEAPDIYLPQCDLYHRQMVPGVFYPGCGVPGLGYGAGVQPVLVEDPDSYYYDD